MVRVVPVVALLSSCETTMEMSGDHKRMLMDMKILCIQMKSMMYNFCMKRKDTPPMVSTIPVNMTKVGQVDHHLGCLGE